MSVIAALFSHLFRPECRYRATTVVLGKLAAGHERQYELFDDNLRIEKLARLSAAVDSVNARFGKHKLHTGTALYLHKPSEGERNVLPWRKAALLDGETPRKRLNLPRLDIEV